MRLSVGAVNIRSGNFVYFDSTTHKIRPEHIMASGALPPGCPAIEVDGELYWDGGLVSNTPLQWVVAGDTRQDTLTFQVDLWSARGDLPSDLNDVSARQKEIQYSSRTRANTDRFKQIQCCGWRSPTFWRRYHTKSSTPRMAGFSRPSRIATSTRSCT
jgi:NTE family protein